MRELPGEDVAEDLEVPVWVRGEAALGLYPVFIEDTKRSEMIELWIVPWEGLVPGPAEEKGIRMTSIQSAKLKLW